MKSILYLSVLFTLFLFGCNRLTEKNNYSIKGKVEGDYTGYIYLSKGSDLYSTTDSIYIEDGEFIFRGKIDHPVPAYFRLKYPSVTQWLRLENSDIFVKGRAFVKHYPDSTSRNFFLIDSVSGSKGELLYKELFSFYDSYNQLDTSLVIKNKILYNRLKNFLGNNPNHYLSGFALGQADDLNENQTKELFSLIDTTSMMPDDLNNIRRLLIRSELLRVGQIFNGFSLSDTSGQMINTGELDSVIILYELWASWCGPCRKKIPVLNEILKKYQNKGFQIIGISFDSKRESWIKAIQKDSSYWIHLSNLKGWKNQLKEQYGVNKIPFNILVNQDREIMGVDLSPEEIEKKIQIILDH